MLDGMQICRRTSFEGTSPNAVYTRTRIPIVSGGNPQRLPCSNSLNISRLPSPSRRRAGDEVNGRRSTPGRNLFEGTPSNAIHISATSLEMINVREAYPIIVTLYEFTVTCLITRKMHPVR